MGNLTFILCVAVAMAIVGETACSRCPPRSKVPGYKQTCTGDYDCRHGMVCCPNWSNTKSCVYPAPYAAKTFGTGSVTKYVYIGYVQGIRKYCDGMKCMPYHVCKPDYTRRLTCQLP
ncbi:waprin-Thr1 [Amyelois transitella]|uniref:waprin-Thr1 n=1 Tax=Amyelois transitella TaxID=680683 RepID=UPI00067CD204|nr:waprin-Thr1 [Amyelois transitella]